MRNWNFSSRYIDNLLQNGYFIIYNIILLFPKLNLPNDIKADDNLNT